MGKQIFNIQGMTRDLSPSKTPNNFAYEIRNLRLTAQEDSTMLSLVSEKGNLQYIINSPGVTGIIIGYCTLNQYLVLFTYDSTNLVNNIYRLDLDTSSSSPTFNSTLLFRGDLGMDDSVKLETIGIYENENIQKVYWIDGIHQPRFINIVNTALAYNENSFDFVPLLNMNESVEVNKASYNGIFNAGTIQYILTYYNKNGQQSAAFYQSPINYISFDSRGASPEDTVSNSFSIKIFEPDTTYDYIRVYSIFRSSENGTPVCKKVIDLKTNSISTNELEYVKYVNVNLGTETAVNYEGPLAGPAYNIRILNAASYSEVDMEDFLEYREGESSYYSIDSNYIIFLERISNHTISAIRAVTGERISMWREHNGTTGINRISTSSVQLRKWASVTATETTANRSTAYIEYIDNGLAGEVVDYSEILYAGGTNIIPSTMSQKSNTLFFGNYKTSIVSSTDKDIIKNNSAIHFGYSKTPIDKGSTGSHYMYDNQLDMDASDITTFKGGETYYFGVILQNENGTWSEVIPIGSKRNSYYPKDYVSNNGNSYFYPVKAYIQFYENAHAVINNYKAIKVVRLDTIPTVIYQGVLCPTVFNSKREDNAPYCQASWFFRDIFSSKADTPHKIQFKHNGNIANILGSSQTSVDTQWEIQGARGSVVDYYGNNPVISDFTDRDIFVDWNTLTLNSPDIEFGSKSSMNYKMRIVGILPITASRTSMMFSWSTPPISSGITNHNVYNPIVHNNLDTLAYEIDLGTFAYRDGPSTTGGSNGIYLYPVYPWHRNGSLTGQVSPTGTDEWAALLDTKVMASLRESALTKYLEGPVYDITKVGIYQEDDVPIMLEEDLENYHYNGPKMYMGSIDTVLTGGQYYTYGKLDNSSATIGTITSGNTEGIRMRYKSTKHGVFSLKSKPDEIQILPNVSIAGLSSVPQGNEFSNISQVAYIKGKVTPGSVVGTTSPFTFNGISDTSQFSPDDVILKLPALSSNNYNIYRVKQILSSTSMIVEELNEDFYNRHGGDKINFTTETFSNDGGEYGDIEKWDSFFIYADTTTTEYYRVRVTHTEGWSLESQMGGDTLQYINDFEASTASLVSTASSDGQQITSVEYDVDSINSDDYAYLYIAELYTPDSIQFRYEDNPWYVASEPIKTGKFGIEASIGDTYYQRYDCLKTYPYALEDQNQIVEIFSFMCETKVNIDGRYDSRRGMIDNTSVTGTNFNLVNKAYTQNDNFFTYHYLDEDSYNINEFPNQIIWTKTKTYGSDIDAWTQIIPTSTLDMNGSLGEVRALRLWNDNLICFQDSGIAKIMYNERTTMSTQQGIPVEIANSGKVDGSAYISDKIGCVNKESIVTTQEGIYFIDSNTREIYRWSQGLESLSKSKGFNTYMQNNLLSMNTEKTFYDPKLKDVYFRFERGSTTECLVYNEQLGQFTSFFDYDMDFMFPFKDSLVSVEHNSSNLWKQFAGSNYLQYFGSNTYKNYKIQLVSAENPTTDKIFTGVEFRADVLNGNITNVSQSITGASDLEASINKSPFETLMAWNEYQSTGVTDLVKMLRKNTNLSQKFRIWRAEIGRDDVDKVHKFNRIRSPWARVELTGGGSNMKTVIHDIAVMYI